LISPALRKVIKTAEFGLSAEWLLEARPTGASLPKAAIKYLAPDVGLARNRTSRLCRGPSRPLIRGSIFGISLRPLSGLFSALALCGTGWLVTQHLSRNYGVPTKFPAVGAKAMTTMAVITLLIVIAIIVMTKA